MIGEDRDTDIAILQIPITGLVGIKVADMQAVRVGDVVLAIGNPLNVGQTVTMGIVSATGRNRIGLNTFENFIQTDAAINPGNSGGALINTRGELIGINSAIYSRGSQGIGFAIPINLAKGVMTQIIETGQVVRGWLGIEAQDMTTQLAEAHGLKYRPGMLIGGVMREGPAGKAGLERNDIVVSINGEKIRKTSAAMKTISEQQPGTMITLAGYRKNVPFSARVQIMQRPDRVKPKDRL